jgi:hypothetical protein
MTCPDCGFSLEHLAGKRLSGFQQEKREKHSDLLLGREIRLHGTDYNASFDSYGDANLEDLVRFALSYGHRAKLPSKGGRAENEVVLAFIPEVIGSGVSKYDISYDPVPCSGVGILSPASETYGHGFPTLDAWVNEVFTQEKGFCVGCGAPTAFGHSICYECYAGKGGDWKNFV